MSLDPHVAVLAGAFFVAALLYSAVGQAGASGYLAVMSLLGMAPAAMKPTAFVLNIAVAAIATARFARAGHFLWSLFWPFALGSVPLAFIGGAITLPGRGYRILVGVVLVVASARLALAEPRARLSRPPSRVVAIAAGAVIGLLSGLTGTGGGIFLSPLLVLAGWADMRQTGGVTAAFILVNSMAGAAGQPLDLAELPDRIPFWLGAAVLGGLLGSELGARHVKAAAFRVALAGILLVAGVKLLWN